MVFQESSKYFLVKITMLIKTESFEEIKERFGDGELKSPFFIIEAGLNEGYD